MGRTASVESMAGTEASEQAPSEIQWKTVPPVAPPAYTENPPQGGQSQSLPKDTPCPGLPGSISIDRYATLTAFVEEQGKADKGKCYSMFCWGIVQIMAATFSADFQRLQGTFANVTVKKILCAADRDPTSILSELGQAGLEQLCALSRRLAADLKRNRWPTVCRWEKLLLIHLVLRPAKILKIPADYALELFGRYKCGEPGGPAKTSTMVDYWTPSCRGIRPKCTSPMLDLGDTMASHAYLIENLHITDEMIIILEDAFTAFSKVRGMDKLQNSKELHEEMLLWKRESKRPEEEKKASICLWPVSDDYYNLFKVLSGVDGMDYDTTDVQKDRLRRNRKSRSYFQFV
jgi:hypothetical protein